MRLDVLRSERRERFCLPWAAFGLYLFLSAFYWASGTAPLRAVFYVFLLLPFLAVLPWRRFRMTEYGGDFTLSALIYAAYTVLTSLWGGGDDFGFFLKQWFFLAFWLTGVAWLFYHRDVQVQRLLLTVIGIAVLCAVLNIYFFYIYKNYDLANRLTGFGLAENSTVIAQVFGVASLLAYIRSLQATSWKLSPLYFIAAMICALPIVMSQSRGAGLALILVALAAMLIIRPKPAIWLPQVILAVVGLTVFFAITPMERILEHRGLSMSFRDAIWKELLLDHIPQHPFFGIGMKENSRIIIVDVDVYQHAHNSWIDILLYAGGVGLALALWHGSLLFRSFSRDRDILPLYLWLTYGCACLFTNGSSLLTRPDAQWWMYWVPAGLLAALVMRRRHVR